MGSVTFQLLRIGEESMLVVCPFQVLSEGIHRLNIALRIPQLCWILPRFGTKMLWHPFQGLQTFSDVRFKIPKLAATTELHPGFDPTGCSRWRADSNPIWTAFFRGITSTLFTWNMSCKFFICCTPINHIISLVPSMIFCFHVV